MDQQLAELRVSYADAKKLLQIDPDRMERRLMDSDERVDAWKLQPGHFMCIRGIYVDVQNLQGIEFPQETDEEQELLEHPEGDPTKPCVEFPCKLGQLKEFLEKAGTNEWIDPFDMAEWLKKKLSKAASEAPPPFQQEKPSHLLTIAALLKLLKASERPRYNQSAIIESIIEGNDGKVKGLSQSNLETMFADANAALKDARKASPPSA